MCSLAQLSLCSNIYTNNFCVIQIISSAVDLSGFEMKKHGYTSHKDKYLLHFQNIFSAHQTKLVSYLRFISEIYGEILIFFLSEAYIVFVLAFISSRPQVSMRIYLFIYLFTLSFLKTRKRFYKVIIILDYLHL